MKEKFMWITPKQAGALANYTPRHIQNLISTGKLSATKEDGKYYIDKSEFFRLFPKAHEKEQLGNPSQQLAERARLQTENTMLKESASQKDKEIEFLRNQIEFISNEKTRMLDTIVNTTKLLEYQEEKSAKSKIRSLRGFFTLRKDSSY